MELFEEDKSSIHNEFSSFEEIKNAVKKGEHICWANEAYDVEYWDFDDSVVVVCNVNGSTIGLGDTNYDISRCFRK